MLDQTAEHAAWGSRLLDLGYGVQRHVHQLLRSGTANLAEPVAQQGGDTIYQLDRQVEPVLEQVIARWPEECTPLLLVAEGLGADGRKRFGPAGKALRYRLIVDPADGTRSLMYDKRSAWFLAAVAEDRGDATRISDTFAAVMVELPIRKQTWADAFVALSGRPTIGRGSLIGGEMAREFRPQPSRATTLRDGFASVVSYFPGTKVLAAELMERIAAATLKGFRPSCAGRAEIFDDQYISTGGQMVELMVGHDRFCVDLRPLFHQIMEQQGGKVIRGLECHPYDIAGAMAARQAGVILTDGFGRPLDAPLDVHTGIHWCGYANRAIQELVEPVIQAWLAEQGLVPPASS